MESTVEITLPASGTLPIGPVSTMAMFVQSTGGRGNDTKKTGVQCEEKANGRQVVILQRDTRPRAPDIPGPATQPTIVDSSE